MKGLGTDEEDIIRILTTRSNRQRQAIAAYFRNELGRDVCDDLRSELGGTFEKVIIALMMSSDQYECVQLNAAMEGAGTDESVLVEILCTKTNAEMKTLVEKYEESKCELMGGWVYVWLAPFYLFVFLCARR